MDDNRAYFGEWLSRTLANKGIAGGAVARAVGVNDSAVSRWRNGKGTPGLESCMKLAAFLDVDPIRLAVTAGLMNGEEVHFDPLPLPEETAKRELVREQLSKISGLTPSDRQALLEAWERRFNDGDPEDTS